MESLVIDAGFWSGRKVFLTGHTGFKGSWMSLVLSGLGAEIHGFALPPRSSGDMFVSAGVERDVRHTIADVRDRAALQGAMRAACPEIVIHMAAQSLVLPSYADPVATYEVNVMGTVHLLEAVCHTPSVRTVIIVTSDKVYENTGRVAAHREGDPIGGYDPYSSSKGCAELITSAYRKSFFSSPGSARVASVRAGNVIGGGDWSPNRLVPDAIRAFSLGEVVKLRKPRSIRPWQHVLEPLSGYLLLVEKLSTGASGMDEAWNFGPSSASEVPVEDVVRVLADMWGDNAHWQAEAEEHPHEADRLSLDCSKARSQLGWHPLFDLQRGLQLTVNWYRAAQDGADMRAFSKQQINEALAKCHAVDRIP